MGIHFDALTDILNNPTLENEKMNNGIIVKDYLSRIVDEVELHDSMFTSPELPSALGMKDGEYDMHLYSFLEKTVSKEDAFLNTRILGIEDRDSVVVMEPREMAQYFMTLCMKINDSFSMICASVIPLGYDISRQLFPMAAKRLYDFLSAGQGKLSYPRDTDFEIMAMTDIQHAATAFFEQAAYLEKNIF